MTEATAADSGAMTTAEAAYFNSGGSVTEGLEAPAEAKSGDTSPPVVADDADLDDKPEVGEDGKPKNKGQWVRYGALKEARESEKALKAENARLAEERARFDERLRILSDAMKEPDTSATEEDPEPDADTDFVAHQKWLARQLKADKAERAKAKEQTEQTTAQERAAKEVIDAAEADAVEFAKENPDFGDAYMHLLNSRAAMYQSMGYTNAEIKTQMRADEIAVYSRAKQTGRSAAQLIYNLSKTVGYVKKAAADGEGKTPDASADISKAIDNIERTNKGLAAAKTLSGAGGSPVQPLTAEALLNMSQEEFNVVSRRHPSEVKRLMGG